MTTLTADTRAAGLDVTFTPGRGVTLAFTFPTGELVGRTFEADVDDVDLAVIIVGDVLTVAASADDTAGLPQLVRWQLVETTGGLTEPTIIGHWRRSTGPAEATDEALVVTTEAATLTVQVGGPPGPTGAGLVQLTAEIVRATAAEAQLGVDIATKASATALAAEIARATAAEVVEHDARIAADAALTTALGTKETPAGAQSKVDALESKLLGGAPPAALDTLAEIGAAITADGSLTAGLVTAVAARALTTDLTAEAAARAAGDTNEATARASADATLTTAVAARALTTDLTAETSRATTAEGLLAPKANPTFTGTPTAPLWVPSGLAGATAASRYVGATASGAPASGTFAVGDYVIDRAGKVWICTTAGTPGTWVNEIAAHLAATDPHGDRAYADGLIGANTELGHVTNETGVNVTTTGTVAVDVTNLVLAVPASARPVMLRASIAFTCTVATLITIYIIEVSNGVDAIRQRQHVISTAVNGYYDEAVDLRLGTTARTRTFKVQVMKSGASGTLTVFVPANADGAACFLRAEAC